MNMKKCILSLSLLLAAAYATAQQPTRYEIDVKEFSELKVVDGINVDYKCVPDSAGKAVFYSTPDVASTVMFVPNKNKLEIQLATDDKKRTNLPKITVYSTYLTFIENAGDSTVRVLNVAQGPKFKARQIGNGRLVVRYVEATQVEASIDTGNGNVIVYGKCERAKLSCTGTGHIQADELVADETKCSLWGTGSIGCNATTTLSVNGAGSGQVLYSGTPNIKNRSIGVKINPLAENKAK